MEEDEGCGAGLRSRKIGLGYFLAILPLGKQNILQTFFGVSTTYQSCAERWDYKGEFDTVPILRA